MTADRPNPPLPGVSLTMIVRDEQADLDACLATVADLVDEVIVVDTGSVDATIAAAERRGARVVRFPWVDDFAAARNAGLDAARHAWVLWLDADDRLDPANRDKLRALLAGLGDDHAAYVFRPLNRPSEFRHHGLCVRPGFNLEPGGPCRVCGSAEAEPIAVVNGLALNSYHAAIDPVRRWVRCRGCGHGYADPRPGPSALREAYAEPPPDHLRQWTYEQVTAWDEVVRGLASHGAGPAWLDAGAGSCGLSAVAREHGFRPSALDLNPAQAEWAARLGIEFVRGDLADVDLGGRTFDLIALGDVVEHLPEPAIVMRRLVGSLAPGGLLWISTPNREGAWARALGDRDPMWLETEHLHSFTKASLDRLLADLGFAAIDYRLSRRYRGCMEATARRVGEG